MTNKKEDTTEEQNEYFIHFVDTYYIDKDIFDNELSHNFTPEEQVVILQTMVAVMAYRSNMFTLETQGKDRLTQTLVEIENFHNLMKRLQSEDWENS